MLREFSPRPPTNGGLGWRKCRLSSGSDIPNLFPLRPWILESLIKRELCSHPSACVLEAGQKQGRSREGIGKRGASLFSPYVCGRFSMSIPLWTLVHYQDREHSAGRQLTQGSQTAGVWFGQHRPPVSLLHRMELSLLH